MLMNPSSCRLMSFFIGVAEVCFMPAPVGDCDNCCPRDDTIDIQYKLYTRAFPSSFEIIFPNDRSFITQTKFNASNPTVIYLMGFSESTTGPSTTTIKNAYLQTGEYNFIAVDWSRLIVFPWYISAVQNTRYMGERLADFIEFMDSAGVNASSIHVIGFSLGAEAAGFAGKNLRRRGFILGRITGLDPAFPGYRFSRRDGHLAKGDAFFVDVIHTNPGLFGFPTSIGDVDFYPNPGTWIQPGCWFDQLLKNMELSFIYGCSHNRAWRLYAESVQQPFNFPATLCRAWRSGECEFSFDGYMGFGALPTMAGKMYLETNDKPPFGRRGR